MTAMYSQKPTWIIGLSAGIWVTGCESEKLPKIEPPLRVKNQVADAKTVKSNAPPDTHDEGAKAQERNAKVGEVIRVSDRREVNKIYKPISAAEATDWKRAMDLKNPIQLFRSGSLEVSEAAATESSSQSTVVASGATLHCIGTAELTDEVQSIPPYGKLQIMRKGRSGHDVVIGTVHIDPLEVDGKIRRARCSLEAEWTGEITIVFRLCGREVATRKIIVR